MKRVLAFTPQASDSNSVRLTLDSNLSLIKEALALGDDERDELLELFPGLFI